MELEPAELSWARLSLNLGACLSLTVALKVLTLIISVLRGPKIFVKADCEKPLSSEHLIISRGLPFNHLFAESYGHLYQCSLSLRV